MTLHSPFSIPINPNKKNKVKNHSLRTKNRKPTEGKNSKKNKETTFDERPLAVIIDDDKISAQIIAYHLIRLGYKTTIANSYNVGLNYIIKKCDLLIADWILDRNTGGDLIKNADSLLNNENLTCQKNIPVITYSSLNIHGIKFDHLNQFKFIGHLQKPLNKVALKNIILTI